MQPVHVIPSYIHAVFPVDLCFFVMCRLLVSTLLASANDFVVAMKSN